MVAKAQERATAMLDGLRRAGKLPPSLLFAGTEGSGKELLAVELAARLNCEVPGEDEKRQCPSCLKIRNLEHPDLHLIYPIPYGEWEKSMPVVIESRRECFFNYGEFGNRARSIGINLIRRVVALVSKQPYEGRYTVVILFEAHLATVEAQNAFLKLLEEPPSSAVFVLVTEFPDRLLPTILSRCQEVRFDLLPNEAVSGFLETFYSVESGEAGRLALLAGGNLRRGIRLLEEKFLGIRSDAVALLRLVLDGKAKELLGESEALSNRYTRDEIGLLLEESVALLRLLLRSLGDSGIGMEMLEESFGKDRIAAASARDIPADLRRIHRAVGSLRRNVDMELTLSQLLLDLAGKWY